MTDHAMSPPFNPISYDNIETLTTPPVFILCETCYWCATYFDKTRIPRENKCPQCNANNNELTSFPIMPNETFIFDYDNKRGVELKFKLR